MDSDLCFKDCKEPEQIAKMLSFATSREGMFLNGYGCGRC